MNTNIYAVYYNRGKPNLFSIRVNVTLSCLKDQLDQINGRFNHNNIRGMDSVEYRHTSIDSSTLGSPR